MQHRYGICRWRRPIPKDSRPPEESNHLWGVLNLEHNDSDHQGAQGPAQSQCTASGFKSTDNVIQSANVFLCKNGGAKLGDMNVSKICQKGLCQTQTGTPYYASPEVWKDKPYDNKSDIWSLGCVVYEMTCLKPPFRAEDMEGLYKKVIRGLYPRIPFAYSADLSNIIRCMLQVLPDCRPATDKLLALSSVLKWSGESTEKEEGEIHMMSTIKIPKNLTFLTGQLPKPQYEDQKSRHTRTVCHIES